jgi:hypothetical protein
MVRSVEVYGGTSVGHQARQLEKGCNIVVGTPGRLLDFIQKGKVCCKPFYSLPVMIALFLLLDLVEESEVPHLGRG